MRLSYYSCPWTSERATVTAFVAMAFSFDDKRTVNPQGELAVATSPVCPVPHHPLFSTTPSLGAPPLLI
jgi:hypothetical protein